MVVAVSSSCLSLAEFVIMAVAEAAPDAVGESVADAADELRTAVWATVDASVLWSSRVAAVAGLVHHVIASELISVRELEQRVEQT